MNVGPSKIGTIEPIFVERLQDMGKWLKNNGEAIYSTVPWIYQNDTKTTGVWYTTSNDEQQIEEERSIVYAIVLEYPFDSAGINLFSLGNRFDLNTEVTMLGYPDKLKVNYSLLFV